jgi:hypothetical protein
MSAAAFIKLRPLGTVHRRQWRRLYDIKDNPTETRRLGAPVAANYALRSTLPVSAPEDAAHHRVNDQWPLLAPEEPLGEAEELLLLLTPASVSVLLMLDKALTEGAQVSALGPSTSEN